MGLVETDSLVRALLLARVAASMVIAVVRMTTAGHFSDVSLTSAPAIRPDHSGLDVRFSSVGFVNSLYFFIVVDS